MRPGAVVQDNPRCEISRIYNAPANLQPMVQTVEEGERGKM